MAMRAARRAAAMEEEIERDKNMSEVAQALARKEMTPELPRKPVGVFEGIRIRQEKPTVRNQLSGRGASSVVAVATMRAATNSAR